MKRPECNNKILFAIDLFMFIYIIVVAYMGFKYDMFGSYDHNLMLLLGIIIISMRAYKFEYKKEDKND